MKLKVIVHAEPEGGYWAEVPALPGCVTQGDTMAELRANLREASAACQEVLQKRAARPLAGASLTLAAMAEARRLAADPSAKSYGDLDELFADALK